MKDEKIKYPSTCKNCGAPLTSGKCAYCGTEYTDYQEIELEGWSGEVTINGEKINVYVGKVDYHVICADSYINRKGIMHVNNIKPKRKITLIEI